MISKRIKSISDFINIDDKVIDVGCDHALLDIHLVKDRQFNKIYVSDVNQKALNNAIENIKNNNFEDNIIPFVNNGIKKIDKLDVDTLVISGMGTATIINILHDHNIKKFKKIILQSNNNLDILRHYMIKKGYKLSFETAVYDKRYYVTGYYVKGKNNLKKYQIKFGISSNINYYKHLIDNEKNIIRHIPNYRLIQRLRHIINIKYINKCIDKNC